MDFMIIVILVAVVLLLGLFFKYEPTLDLVVSGHFYILLLWYNSYEGEVQRTYKQLFRIKC